jgi:hypothetical protein
MYRWLSPSKPPPYVVNVVVVDPVIVSVVPSSKGPKMAFDL